MLAHKHITKIVTVITVITVCLCFTAMAFSEQLTALAGGVGITSEYESELFDTSEIIQINIQMDAEEWQNMLDKATAEEYYQCNVEVNGKMYYSVGIRPKGNTSLTSIASDPTTNRYSFKLEFDQFTDGQTCCGLDKLILNNNYADATNMKEALIYDMFAYLETDASLYNYAKISVNGEYWGIYLALEAVEDSFLLRNYGVKSGELYKPDSMNMNMGGGDFDVGNMDFAGMNFNFGASDNETSSEATQDNGTVSKFSIPEGGMQPPENGQMPDMSAMPNMGGERPEMPNGEDIDFSAMGGGKGGFSMGGSGANLNYSDDELDSYSTIWQGEVTGTSDSDHKRVVTALKNISEGTELEKYMDIDNLLRYMAVHIFSVNSDSLSGSMAHNYYLYEENGQLNIIPWDYNLALGGMGGGSDATSTVNDAIDNAFSGTKFFDTLMENGEYHAQYYAWMQKLVDGYLRGEGFESFYNRVRSQIDALVESDPNAFYSYEEYLTAVETLYEVVKLRGESIAGQISGTIPSTASEQRNSDTLIDASHLDLGVMGSMSMGGGFGGENGERRSFGRDESAGEEAASDNVLPDTTTPADTSSASDIENLAATKSENAISTIAMTFDPEQMSGAMPEGFDPAQMPEGFDPGQMPEGFDPEQMPEGFDPAQAGGEMPENFSTVQAEAGTQNANETTTNVQGETNASKSSGSFGRNNMPGNFSGGTSSTAATGNLIVYGICIVILLGALMFAKLYHRKPRKR